MTDGYENIRCAILRQAVKDYKKALRCGNRAEIKKLEKFFLGDWGEFLSINNGAQIIEKVRKDINKNGGSKMD